MISTTFVQIIIDFTYSDFEIPMQLQIEVKEKILDRSVIVGTKFVEKIPQTENLLELTTPTIYVQIHVQCHSKLKNLQSEKGSRAQKMFTFTNQ